MIQDNINLIININRDLYELLIRHVIFCLIDTTYLSLIDMTYFCLNLTLEMMDVILKYRHYFIFMIFLALFKYSCIPIRFIVILVTNNINVILKQMFIGVAIV